MNWTKEEELEFNKRCAEFLGWKKYEGINSKYYDSYNTNNINFGEMVYFKHNLKFHSDWNWIMEVVETIERTYDEFHGFFGVHISSNSCVIQGTKLRTDPKNPHYAYFNETIGNLKQEAIIQAINQFLIWYNKK